MIFFFKNRYLQHKKIGIDTRTFKQLRTLQSKGVKTVLYAPTFRRGMQEFHVDTLLNFKTLLPFLEEQNIHLFISLHPKYRSNNSNINSTQVHLIAPSDIQPLLPYFSLILTDYSSLFTDALLLDIPILFYPFDYETYQEKEGLLDDFVELSKPLWVTEQNLPMKIVDALREEIPEAQKALKQTYHKHTDGKAAKRITQILRS